MTTLWLDPRFGASGDMLLGTLVGLGVDLDQLDTDLRSTFTDLPSWRFERSTTSRCSLAATKVTVSAEETHAHRAWSTIDALLADAALSEMVIEGARHTFHQLGTAEASIHSTTIDQVHFHEVGAVDAIVDIVGVWLGLDQLRTTIGLDRVMAGPVGIGHGTVEAAHGTLPIPAPATAALLEGVPVQPLPTPTETITPTGAALLQTMVDGWGPMPAGVLRASARGAGGRDPATHPNVLTGYLLDASATSSLGQVPALELQARVQLSTNLDDVTPEIVGHTMQLCLAAGADDVWSTPIIMKKGRPGVEVNVLISADRTDELCRLLMAETGTLGVRSMPLSRFVAPRHFETVSVRGRAIAIKIGPYGAKPEYGDLALASADLGVPLRQLAQEALDAWNG